MQYHSFTVLPTTPPKLAPLLEMANNLWFSWNWDARQLFAKIDRDVWIKAHKNPLRMLCDIPQERLKELAEDKEFVHEVEAVYSSFKSYISSGTWFQSQYPDRKDIIAYFSCEFGLHESLPIYSGGLGVLAGDHLKSASDLGLPLVAVGFLYRQGYFRQGLNSDGDQQEFYPENDWFSLPANLVKGQDDKPIMLSMDIGGDEVFYQIWKVHVGRIHLYLLDTNLPSNLPKHQDITKRLYDSDRDMRLRQEVLLGIGGVKALKALGIKPSVYHINEGHSAFLILERLREFMGQGLTFDEAKEIVWASNVFTTHTPVPAGNERFDIELMKLYLKPYVEHHLKLRWPEFLELGKEHPEKKDKKDKEGKTIEQEFCLTVLALKFSSFCNGVAKLHGVISRDMWKQLYSGIPTEEVPIGHITNGVHTKTWLSKTFEGLFMRYLNTAYSRETADFTVWKIIDSIPDDELWEAHMERKKGLIEYARERMKWQLKRRGASAGEVQKARDIMDPKILTIGFARRFAPYKRGDLLLDDIPRLIEIICSEERPVQFIFAGKAHPADERGKNIIKKIIEASTTHPQLAKRLIFLEDYDIDMARFLVQGVDVWLNTPRRPMEASGTSGMKAAMNGALNLSILDGWWDEAFDTKNGWGIGHGEMYEDVAIQDKTEANLLYRLLETEVVPTYYDQDADGVPKKWLQMMKRSIRDCGQKFNAHRMVMDYLERYYLKGQDLFNTLSHDNFKETKELSAWRRNLREKWNQIKLMKVCAPDRDAIYSGSEVEIKAHIDLAGFPAEELIVEVYHGTLGNDGEIHEPHRLKMNLVETQGNISVFSGNIACKVGGNYGYTVRILPGHKNLANEFIPELIKWED